MTPAPGRTLHLVSAGAARGLAQAIAPAFEAAHGARIEGTFGAVGAMRERLAGGATCDVVILTAALIGALAADDIVVPASCAPLGRVRTGIAVRGADPHPDVRDAAALARAISAANAIFFPDAARATAGIHFMRVLDRLGIRASVEHTLRPYESGAVAMAAMSTATEPVVLGCTQVTEILYTAGVALVAPLPADFELVTPYVAAVSCSSREPALAGHFIAALAGPASLALREAGGFDR